MSKAKKTGGLFIGSVLHIRRGNRKDDEGKTVPNIVTIAHGQMVSDTDLTDEEIESLSPHGVLRAPTSEEMQAMDAAEEQKSAAEEVKAAGSGKGKK
jgi:hypothetical protein